MMLGREDNSGADEKLARYNRRACKMMFCAMPLLGTGLPLLMSPIDSQQESHEDLEAKIASDWLGWAMEGKEKMELRIKESMAYISYLEPRKSDVDKKELGLPDEVKVKERVIDLVDAGEISGYQEKKNVKYAFSQEGKGYVEIVISGKTNKDYKTLGEAASDLEKNSKDLEVFLDRASWGFSLAEADRVKADGVSAERASSDFLIKDFKSHSGERIYGLFFKVVPEATFYFKKK